MAQGAAPYDGSPVVVSARPPIADDLAVGLKERLRRLDNQAMGEPLSIEARRALLAVQRPRWSTRFAMVAVIAGIVFVLGISGVVHVGDVRLGSSAFVMASIGWVAFRMRRVEREVVGTARPGTSHPLPSPPRLGWLPPSILAAALIGIGVPTALSRSTARGVVDLVAAALCVSWAGVRFARWRRFERKSHDPS